MKQIICLLLCLLMAFTCAACAGEQPAQTTSPKNENTAGPETAPSATDDPRFAEVERDANGNIIRTLEGDREGAYTERFYDANGQITKEVQQQENGQHDERTFYENGQIHIEEIHDAEGMIVINIFTEDGRRETEELHFPDGSMECSSFDIHDRRVHMQRIELDGTVIDIDFDENQCAFRETAVFTDGSILVREFHSEGVVKYEHHQFPDGSAAEREFDTEGNLIRDVQIDPDGNVNDLLVPTEPSEPNDSGSTQGTQVGSVTTEGNYTVVVLGQDNWANYLEEYTDILFLPDQDRLILRKYFIVKAGVGEVDADRSHVELQYIYENRTYECTVDMANQKFTPGKLLSTGQPELSYIDSEQFRVLNWQYVDGELLGYGLSCSACELNGASTVYPDSVITGIQWIVGTLYLKQ